MTPEQTKLVRDLLDAQVLNLQSSIQAIESDDNLYLLYGEEGLERLRHDAELAQATRDALTPSYEEMGLDP